MHTLISTKLGRSPRPVFLVLIALSIIGCKPEKSPEAVLAAIAKLPEYSPESVILNHEWHTEEGVEIQGYDSDAMEVGISADGAFLLFNDNNEPNKDLHWAKKISATRYHYQGKVKNTVSNTVDGTPSFDSHGNIFFTSLKNFRRDRRSIYRAQFRNGVALTPEPVSGDIYVLGQDRRWQTWISLDPDVTADGRLMFYSEGLFDPRRGFPQPYNVRGAELVAGKYLKLPDKILANINTDSLEYAPAISDDGLEIFFSRISRINGRPTFVGIYAAKRKSRIAPFSTPEKIMAITGEVEAPVLSGDEKHLYYHRKTGGLFRVFRVTRKPR